MIMSPGSSSGANSSITASVAAPAFTMMTRRRGRSRLATNSSAVRAGTKVPSWPNSSMMASVLAVVLLCRAVAYPCLAKLRARLRPITPSPVTPICAVAWAVMSSCVSLGFLSRAVAWYLPSLRVAARPESPVRT